MRSAQLFDEPDATGDASDALVAELVVAAGVTEDKALRLDSDDMRGAPLVEEPDTAEDTTDELVVELVIGADDTEKQRPQA